MRTIRLAIPALLGVFVLAAVLATDAHSATQPADQSASQPGSTQESGSPINDQGSSYNYRSYIRSVAPRVPGLNLEVLEFADRLVLRNHTGRTVTVYGYEGEPYARVQANGTVEVNTASPAYYLNQNFYAQVTVPASAGARATPHWTVVDRTGQFEWHDHRIHWMSPVPPAQVKDRSRRTKIFDWKVPIQVGSQAVAVNGQLFWVPEEGTKTPVAAIVALIGIVIAALAFVLFVRSRRRKTSQERPEAPAKEAW
jgi:hypothetical protein